MFRGTFAGKPLYSSRTEAENQAKYGYPVPPEFHRANSFFNPLGRESGKGWLFISRADLDAIDLNGLHTLTFQYEDQENTPKAATQTQNFYNLVICKEPQEVSPSYDADDPDAAFLVEVADSRWRVHNPYFHVAAKKYYNVRAGAYQGGSGTTEFLSDSLNSGSLWTWQTLVSDLWALMTTQLGTAPTLPFTPDGTPEGFIFLGMSAWEALNQVLDRIGCAVKCDLSLSSNQFSYIRVGSTDAASDAILSTADARNYKIHDSRFQTIARGKLPRNVRVFFHRKEKYTGTEETTPRDSTQWLTQSVYTVDVAGPDTTNSEAGTYHPIWDDLPAIYDESGSLSNSSDLSTRATERANDYFRQLRSVGGDRLNKRYTGLLDLQPGSTLKGVSWHQSSSAFRRNDGVFTEIIRHPSPFMKAEGGKWEESSTRLCPPDFRPTVPVYPQLTQVIEIANGTISSGKYDATVEKFDPTGLSFSDKEACWAVDVNGKTGTLITGSRYHGRLAGYASSRPVYLIDPPTITVLEVDGSPSYTDIREIRFDQADGFVLTQPAAGVVRIDFPGSPGSTINVEASDGSPSYTSIGTITFNEVTGFIITNPSAGTAAIEMASCGGAGAGVVDLSDPQAMGAGAKGFEGVVVVADTSLGVGDGAYITYSTDNALFSRYPSDTGTDLVFIFRGPIQAEQPGGGTYTTYDYSGSISGGGESGLIILTSNSDYGVTKSGARAEIFQASKGFQVGTSPGSTCGIDGTGAAGDLFKGGIFYQAGSALSSSSLSDFSSAVNTLIAAATITTSQISDIDATLVPYTPTTGTDWNGAAPTTVQEGLDRCAALLKTLNGGTGP